MQNNLFKIKYYTKVTNIEKYNLIGFSRICTYYYVNMKPAIKSCKKPSDYILF